MARNKDATSDLRLTTLSPFSSVYSDTSSDSSPAVIQFETSNFSPLNTSAWEGESSELTYCESLYKIKKTYHQTQLHIQLVSHIVPIQL